MPNLQRLRADHAAAVLAFEVENRAYFAASITDRGDAFFAGYEAQHHRLLAEQDAGRGAYYVLVNEEGAVVGRFNLYDIDGRSADVGYRVAQHVAGRGVASSALQELLRLASEHHGVTSFRAMTADENLASRRVLEKAGFVEVGSMDVAGRPGTMYRCELRRAETS